MHRCTHTASSLQHPELVLSRSYFRQAHITMPNLRNQSLGISWCHAQAKNASWFTQTYESSRPPAAWLDKGPDYLKVELSKTHRHTTCQLTSHCTVSFIITGSTMLPCRNCRHACILYPAIITLPEAIPLLNKQNTRPHMPIAKQTQALNTRYLITIHEAMRRTRSHASQC